MPAPCSTRTRPAPSSSATRGPASGRSPWWTSRRSPTPRSPSNPSTATTSPAPRPPPRSTPAPWSPRSSAPPTSLSPTPPPPGPDADSEVEAGALVAAVGGSTALPVADRDTPWDGDAAASRVFELCTDGDTVDPQCVARAFLWRDDDADPTTRAAYRLGFADV